MKWSVLSPLNLSTSFDLFERRKVDLCIIDYSISQCTLEQIFIRFAKQQDEETGHIAGVVYE